MQMGREVLSQQPFSRLLGTELAALAPGQVELQLPLRGDLLQQNGFAHGGSSAIWPTTRSPLPAVSYTHLTLPTICSV